MNNSLARFTLSVCLLFSTQVIAKPRLVPISDAVLVPAQSSHPTSLLKVGSQVFFTANDGVHGTELWRTDGTSSGTAMVVDLQPSQQLSSPAIAGALGNAVVFSAYDGVQHALWRSDGTSAGTWRLFAYPLPLQNSTGYGIQVIPADTRVFIIVQQSYTAPQELWVSEGLQDDARKVATIQIAWTPVPLGAGGKLYFVASDDIVGSQFWISDGTLLGTHMLARPAECSAYASCGPRPLSFSAIGSQMLFGTEDKLWVSNGTSQGTVAIASTPAPYFLASASGVAYFTSGGSLWRTNGTSAGTTSAGPLAVTNASIHSRIMADQRLAHFFYGSSPLQLWISNGTPAGTQQLGTFVQGPGTQMVGVVGTSIFFTGSSTAGSELWLADANTGGPALLKDIDPRSMTNPPSSSSPGSGAALGSMMLFPATDKRGRELWKSDGTAAGTQLLVNIAAEAAGGIVSGTVRDSVTSAPIAGAIIRLCASSCESTQVVSDAQGRYRIEGVIPGTYRAYADNATHLAGFHGGGSGTAVNVVAGFETQNVDFSLQRGGTISGSVKRASTGNATGARIYIRNPGGTIVDSVSLAPDGTYRSNGLPTGTYYVETYGAGLSSPVVDQVYAGVNCPPYYGCLQVFASGQSIFVTAGSDITGIHFSLPDYGRIAGTVRDSSNGAGIHASVTLFVEPGNINGVTVHAEADGSYLTPLIIPGTYRVVATESGFPITAHPNTVCTSYDCASSGATPVTVPVNGTISGIDIAMTPATPRLIGTVRSADGTPLVDMQVVPLDQQGESVGTSTFTDGLGAFAITDLQAGTYYIQVEEDVHPNIHCAFRPCNVAGATPVTVANNQTTSVDITLRSRMTTISGTVRDGSTSTVIMNPDLRVRDAAKSYLSIYARSDAPDGQYTVRVLSRSTGFYVTAFADRNHHTAYPNGRVRNDGTLPATATQLAPGTHTGIDITLPRYGSIAGNVINRQTGAPLDDRLLYFVSTSDSDFSGFARTTDDGTYLFERAYGSYYVYVNTDHQYTGQVYPHLDCSGNCVPANGNAVAVPNAGAVTGIDFDLQPVTVYGKITGRVVDDLTGLGVANVSIYGLNWTSVTTDAQGYYSADVTTGSYKLYALPPQPYYVSVYGGAHCSTNAGCDVEGGSSVSVNAPNTTSGIEFRLIRLAVTGISPASGTVFGGTNVTITGRNFTPQTTVQIGGRAATISSITATQIVARTPSGTPGHAHVTVTVPPSLTVSLIHAFTYAPVAFTDATLTSSTRLKAVHILELRDAINVMRGAGSLPPATFTDASLAGARVRNVHLLELRSALSEARTALGRSTLTYTNPLTVNSPIRAIDIIEIRNGVQ